MNLVYRQYLTEQVRGVDTAKRTLSIIASDFSLDSYGTRIDPAGWDLEQFRKNGPICIQHDSYSRNGLPVAQAVGPTVRVDNGLLLMDIQFPPEGVDETADRAYALAAAGILRGVSVGFDVEETEQSTERMPDGREFTVTIYRKQRLMEVSLVTIPSNDNCLVQRAVKLNRDEHELRKMTEDLESSLKNRSITVHSFDALIGILADGEVKTELDKRWNYFNLKHPAIKESTKVLARFFEKILKTAPPADEVEAWKRMADAVEAIEEAPAPTEPSVVEELKNTPTPIVEETPIAPIPETENPSPEQKNSVQIPVSNLLDLPARLSKSYLDTATEALRRGVPIKDVMGMIDGMNSIVTTSISQVSHGHN